MQTLFDLHKAQKKADWAYIPEKERNFWQKIAASSNGWITPANAVTVTGGITVLIGLIFLAMESFAIGIILLLIGRAADILDGIVAQATGTKSPLGEFIDASTDKILAIVAILVLLIFHLAPVLVLLLIAFQSVLNASLSLLGRKKGTIIHPSRSGKLSTAALWFSLALFVLNSSLEKTNLLLTIGALAAFGIFLILGYGASYSYLKQYRSIK